MEHGSIHELGIRRITPFVAALGKRYDVDAEIRIQENKLGKCLIDSLKIVKFPHYAINDRHVSYLVTFNLLI